MTFSLGPDDPDTLPTMCNLGICYANVKNYAAAETAFRDVINRCRANSSHVPPWANSVFGRTLNALAWMLATCSDPAVRAGTRAVGLAEEAVAKIERKVPSLLDSLGAAYAEVGEFAKAAGAEREAITLYG